MNEYETDQQRLSTTDEHECDNQLLENELNSIEKTIVHISSGFSEVKCNLARAQWEQVIDFIIHSYDIYSWYSS